MSKILLDQADFDALQVSFLAHDGVGAVSAFRYYSDGEAVPHCVLGHAAWLEGLEGVGTDTAMATEMGKRLLAAGLTWQANDEAVMKAQRNSRWTKDRIDFETYIQLLNIDIKE